MTALPMSRRVDVGCLGDGVGVRMLKGEDDRGGQRRCGGGPGFEEQAGDALCQAVQPSVVGCGAPELGVRVVGKIGGLLIQLRCQTQLTLMSVEQPDRLGQFSDVDAVGVLVLVLGDIVMAPGELAGVHGSVEDRAVTRRRGLPPGRR